MASAADYLAPLFHDLSEATQVAEPKELSTRLDGLADKVAVVETGCEHLVNTIRTDLETGARVDLDALLDEILEQERRAAMALGPLLALAREEKHDRYENLLSRVVQAVERCRWDLILIRADLERGQFVSPVLETPSEVQAFLDSLKS